MNAALYWSIWIALALFAAGEAGKRALRADRPVSPLAWPAWMAGLAFAVAHTAIAFGVRQLRHADAVTRNGKKKWLREQKIRVCHLTQKVIA